MFFFLIFSLIEIFYSVSTEPRIYTARSRKHRQKTPVLSENIYPSKSVLNDTYRRDSTERINKKQQQRLNLDPNDSCRRLKTENSRVLIDTKPVQKLIQNQKVIRLLQDFF